MSRIPDPAAARAYTTGWDTRRGFPRSLPWAPP